MMASDAESMSVPELLAMAAPIDRAAYENLWLGYTETTGLPALREAIASTYASRRTDEILVTAGAEEAIYATLQTVLDRGSHAIVVTPNYQSHETVAQSICAVTGVPLNADDAWSLDIDRVAAAILSRERFDTLVSPCRKHGIYLFSDEVFRLLGPEGTEHLPQVADVYERGISLGVMSKAFGLGGLRIGWLASADREMLRRIEHTKHYLSICNAGPSERLAIIALKARETGSLPATVVSSRKTSRSWISSSPNISNCSSGHGLRVGASPTLATSARKASNASPATWLKTQACCSGRPASFSQLWGLHQLIASVSAQVAEESTRDWQRSAATSSVVERDEHVGAA
jgi:aspartate/methionine/tyrosine aminotransferase